MNLHKIAFILLIVGGINWLLQAFNTGLSAWLPENVAMVIYILVGLAAIYEIFSHKNRCKDCVTKTV